MLRRLTLLLLPALSSGECCAALVRGGYRVASRTVEATVFEAGLRVVVVPDAEVLAAEDLSRILRAAGLDSPGFLALFEDDGGSPRPPVPSHPSAPPPAPDADSPGVG